MKIHTESQNYQSNIFKQHPKIICVGKNYLKHVIEMGGTDVPNKPILFLKPWSSLSYQPTTLHLSGLKEHIIDH